MNLKVVENKEAPLLDRNEIKADLTFTGVPPSVIEVKKKLAEQLSVKEDMLIIKKIVPKYGFKEGTVLATLNKNAEKMEDVEPEYVLEKQKPKEKKEAKKEEAPKEEPIAEETKTESIVRLNELQNKISLQKNRRHVGEIHEVLIERESTRKSPHDFQGRNDGNKIVILPKGNYQKGDFVRVKISDVTPHVLKGKIATEEFTA